MPPITTSSRSSRHAIGTGWASACAKLRGPVQTVHLLWLNNFRYSHESRLRKHLSDTEYFKRLKRGSDTLKVACIELMDAAWGTVIIGDERWRNP